MAGVLQKERKQQVLPVRPSLVGLHKLVVSLLHVALCSRPALHNGQSTRDSALFVFLQMHNIDSRILRCAYTRAHTPRAQDLQATHLSFVKLLQRLPGFTVDGFGSIGVAASVLKKRNLSSQKALRHKDAVETNWGWISLVRKKCAVDSSICAPIPYLYALLEIIATGMTVFSPFQRGSTPCISSLRN